MIIVDGDILQLYSSASVIFQTLRVWDIILPPPPSLSHHSFLFCSCVCFNLKILCEKHLQYQQDLCHVVTDIKKVFDRVYHAALWATTKKYNISTNLIQVIKNLYNKASSAVLFNGAKGDWFRTTVGV